MTLSFTTVVSSLVNRKQTTSSEHGFSETNLLLGGDDRVNLRPFQKRPFRHLAGVPPSPECQNQKTAINARHGSSSKRSAHSCLCPPLLPVPEPQRRCREAPCLHRGLSCPSLAHSPAALPGQLDVTAQQHPLPGRPHLSGQWLLEPELPVGPPVSSTGSLQTPPGQEPRLSPWCHTTCLKLGNQATVRLV